MRDIQEALANGLKFKCEMAKEKFAEFEATGLFDQEDFGFAQELATQYGASEIDDDGDVFAITTRDLYVLMCVLGYSRAKKGDQPASQEKADEEQDDKWRDVALRFDRHRMQALWHLQALLKDPVKHADAAREFIKSPPAQEQEQQPSVRTEFVSQHINRTALTVRSMVAESDEKGADVVADYVRAAMGHIVKLVEAIPEQQPNIVVTAAPQAPAAAVDAGPCQRCSGSGRITCGSGTSDWPPRMRTEACPACSGAGAAMSAQAKGEKR